VFSATVKIKMKKENIADGFKNRPAMFYFYRDKKCFKER